MRVAGLRARVASVGMAVLACAVTASASAAQPTASANRVAAGRDATTLLSQLVLPSWARSTASEPAGDHRLLTAPAASPDTPLVDRHEFWLVSSPLRAMEAFVAKHQRPTLMATGSGMSGGPGVPANESLTFTLAHPPAGIQSESLVVNLVALADGGTGVRADAQVVWTVLRSATERVPAGVTEIEIRRGLPGQGASLATDVVAPSKIKQIVTMIDRLPVVQPGVFGCPAEPTEVPRVTFSFRAAPGTVLATASEDADVSEPTGPCNALSFNLRGQTEPALLHGASFLHAVSRLVGIQLSAPAPAPTD